jgi:hypothetical protein
MTHESSGSPCARTASATPQDKLHRDLEEKLSTQSGSGNGSDRWFGMFRNVTLAANLAAVIQFATIQQWTGGSAAGGFDPYGRGEVGSVWAAAQFFLLAALGLANWFAARQRGDQLGLFWLIAGGGALCLGVNEYTQSFRIWPGWAVGSFADGSPESVARIANMLGLGAGLCGVLLAQVFGSQLRSRPRFAYYWNWGIGLSLTLGILGFLPVGGTFGTVCRLASGSVLLSQAFFFLAFFSEWYARAAEQTELNHASQRADRELVASASR